MDIFILITIIIVIGALALSIDYYRLWCNKKCPYCGHRLDYVYDREGIDGLEHGFHCSKCKAWVYIKAKELIGKKKNKDGTK